MTYGFVKVAAAIPKTKVADCIYNTIEIEKLIREAGQKHIEIIVFPELCITSYTCGDLFTQQLLIESAEKALKKLIDKTSDEKLLCVVGAPVIKYSMPLSHSKEEKYWGSFRKHFYLITKSFMKSDGLRLLWITDKPQ